MTGKFYIEKHKKSVPNTKQVQGSTKINTDVSITTLLAVGDIMLSRNVGAKIDQAKNPNLPFEKTADLLKNADIAFGNLECPLSDSTTPIRQGLVFRCLTYEFDGVTNAGFDVLSTANNHAFDQGQNNINFTIDYLLSYGILPVGTRKSDAFTNSMELVNGLIKRNGIKFGFLAYSYSARNDGKTSTDPQIATMDSEQLKTDIKNLQLVGTDVIIVNMHAGTEYTRHPNHMQIDFAHAAINAGADIVLGEHPHWIQDVEIYNGKPIFYSLGNFVFDQMFSQETREGLMVKLTFLNKKLTTAELIPVIIDNYCCPRFATTIEKQKLFEKTQLQPFLNF